MGKPVQSSQALISAVGLEAIIDAAAGAASFAETLERMADALATIVPHAGVTVDEGEPSEASLALPLVAGGESVGTLHVRREPADFTAEEVRVCRSFATLVAMARVTARQRETALVDPLTGAYNRRHFEGRLTEALSRARRHDEPAGLIVLQLDGRPGDDRVLRTFADILRAQSREDDVICRIGGEHFAVIHPGGDATAAHAWAERVLAAVRSSELTASAGMTITWGDEAVDEVVMRAEANMRFAEREGGDRLVGP